MNEHHMAEHLEVAADLCRAGNAAGIATARSMLAHRQMLEALEDASRRLEACALASGNDAEFVAIMLKPYRDAIAAAKGADNA